MDLNLAEEAMVKLASLGDGSNHENMIWILGSEEVACLFIQLERNMQPINVFLYMRTKTATVTDKRLSRRFANISKNILNSLLRLVIFQEN